MADAARGAKLTNCFGDRCFPRLDTIFDAGTSFKTAARSVAHRQLLHLTVGRLDGSAPLAVAISADLTVADLRQRLACKFAVLPERQRLLFGATILEGYMTLSEACIADGDHITLIVMPEEVELLTSDVGSYRDNAEDFDFHFGRIHRELWRFPEGLTAGARVIYESVTREELPESIAFRQPCELNMLPRGWSQEMFPMDRIRIEGTVLEVQAGDESPSASVSVELAGHPEQSVSLDTCKVLKGFTSPALAHRVACQVLP